MNINEIIKKEMGTIATDESARLRRTVPVNTGRLYRSLEVIQDNNDSTIVAMFYFPEVMTWNGRQWERKINS